MLLEFTAPVRGVDPRPICFRFVVVLHVFPVPVPGNDEIGRVTVAGSSARYIGVAEEPAITAGGHSISASRNVFQKDCTARFACHVRPVFR